MNSSDITRIRRLQVLGATETIQTIQAQNHTKITAEQLLDIRIANRLFVPLSKTVGQNFQ
jgi:hypothetical protein